MSCCCQPSASDVMACFCLAVSLFAASLIPFFLLVDTDLPDLRPAVRRWLTASREAFRDAGALLLLLMTAPKGVAR